MSSALVSSTTSTLPSRIAGWDCLGFQYFDVQLSNIAGLFKLTRLLSDL